MRTAHGGSGPLDLPQESEERLRKLFGPVKDPARRSRSWRYFGHSDSGGAKSAFALKRDWRDNFHVITEREVGVGYGIATD